MTTLNTTVNGIADTTNLGLCDVALTRAIDRSTSLPGMVCLYGPSGFGKSMAACYTANSHRAFYVQAKSVWTKAPMLKAILREMGVTARSTISDMLDQVAEELVLSGRPLILDEMDHIVERNLVELVRDIYEASQTPILLIGEELLPNKLKKYERFHGRVLAWIPAQPVSFDDAQKLVQLYAPNVEICDDLLNHIVEISGGSVRRVAVNLELIQERAIANGWDSVDRRTWGKETLYTGEAPKRRLV
ncbi:MAG: AAA family ATPase [Pontibacterium sp.]